MHACDMVNVCLLVYVYVVLLTFMHCFKATRGQHHSWRHFLFIPSLLLLPWWVCAVLCGCHGDPTSQPISCSHISTWSFIFLSYTTALEKQHRGAPSGVDANTLLTFPRWLVFVIVNMWCLGTVRTDWSYEGWEYQKFPTANTIRTGVFSHNDIMCLSHSCIHTYIKAAHTVPLGSAVRLRVCVCVYPESHVSMASC